MSRENVHVYIHIYKLMCYTYPVPCIDGLELQSVVYSTLLQETHHRYTVRGLEFYIENVDIRRLYVRNYI